jgi:hypothetical protein
LIGNDGHKRSKMGRRAEKMRIRREGCGEEEGREQERGREEVLEKREENLISRARAIPSNVCTGRCSGGRKRRRSK